MRLLTAHKILISCTLALALVLIIWGADHAFRRGQPDAWVALVLGLVMLPLGALYLRRIIRKPPVR